MSFLCSVLEILPEYNTKWIRASKSQIHARHEKQNEMK